MKFLKREKKGEIKDKISPNFTDGKKSDNLKGGDGQGRALGGEVDLTPTGPQLGARERGGERVTRARFFRGSGPRRERGRDFQFFPKPKKGFLKPLFFLNYSKFNSPF